eukprot:gene27140-biopygen17690
MRFDATVSRHVFEIMLPMRSSFTFYEDCNV